MSVPKRRKTKSTVNQRRMHHFLASPVLVNCSKCGKPKRAHSVCLNCGFYKKREVIDVLGKLEKKEKKRREKEIKETAKQEKEQTQEKPMTLEELSKQKFS
jgi:large subunit ribosomal protein L32